MITKQILIEFKKALSFNRIIIWFTILTIPSLFQLMIIRENYLFNNSIEIYHRLISNYIPMLFPIFMILVFVDTLISEKNNNYLLYTRTRIWLPKYLLSKGIVNAVMAFILSFLLVFLPFLYVILVEPSLDLIDNGVYTGNPADTSTFDQFLQYGLLPYGLVYSTWVGINGVIYATLPFLLSLCFRNHFIALSIPFIWYQAINFLTAILQVPMFSPLSTIFPFNLTQQDVWTVFVPFSFHIVVIICLILYLLKRPYEEWLK